MGKSFITDKDFTCIDFATGKLNIADYENCTFKNCNFAETSLSEIAFEDCRFEDCDLSNISAGKTAFRNVVFKNCKLTGVRFEECNPFLLTFRFENCQLNLSSFYQLKIKETKFESCLLLEADLTEADLTGSAFLNCDFSGAVFENTNLEKTDFRSSFNFIVNPEINRIQGAKFSFDNITGLLHQYNIIIE